VFLFNLWGFFCLFFEIGDLQIAGLQFFFFFCLFWFSSVGIELMLHLGYLCLEGGELWGYGVCFCVFFFLQVNKKAESLKA